ncbi:S66 peptidase family protein [Rudanella lutea]|uniref:S66 peptidase family protein n=1 Tax=Rudanella lutea TaxID=451374 RepID=UPI00036823C2|nr:LD-carboxypeptidase [Rudanella lutea]
MIIPPFLKPGDTVGVVAPASHFEYQDLQPGLAILRDQWHLNVIEGESLQARSGPFAGSDDLRRRDLQQLFDNPDVRAVLAARGGYGSYRIADSLDLTGLIRHPKWLVGFSDITVLLSLLVGHGVACLHGIMPRGFAKDTTGESIENLRQWLFGEHHTPYQLPPHPLNRAGQTTAPVVGGNLTLLINSLGTPTDLDYTGKILFIEDIDETLFSLDRMMHHLRRSGRLAGLAGLVVGQFTDMVTSLSLPFGLSPDEIIAQAVAGYDFPVCYGLPSGHDTPNWTLPIGLPATLTVAETGAALHWAL